MNKRLSAALVAASFVTMLSGGASSVLAQAPTTTPAPGWTYSLQPYLWLPRVTSEVNYTLPLLGATATDTITSSPTNYISHLNFAAMFSGEVRDDRFSVLTDFMYVNFSNTNSDFRTGNAAILPSNPFTATGTLNTGTRLGAAIWTLGGGYTLLQGGWGNLDGFAGFRAVFVNSKTNSLASLSITGPRGGTATILGPGQNLTVSRDVWNGVGGVRGKIVLPDVQGFFIPYYVDIGAGQSNLTWQVATGVGYQAGWGDLSVGWRYLTFEQGSGSALQRLSLTGPFLAANLKF